MTKKTIENWEIAETVGTEEEASLVAGFLEAEGIPSQVESLLFHQEPTTFGGLAEVRILVGPADLERARALIAAREDATASDANVEDSVPRGEPNE
jgi:hypothetical protein